MKPGAISPENYTVLLSEKAETLNQKFASLMMPELEVYTSSPQYYRMRTEFRIWHDDDQLHYTMFDPAQKDKRYFLTEFPVASKRINELMPQLMKALQDSPDLSRRLFQVDFLTTQTDEALVSLIYHRPLDDAWKQAARRLEAALNIYIIGRSRKKKCVLSQDHVMEKLTVKGRVWRYQQCENSFTQPNAGVNEKMLGWASDVVQSQKSEKSDLVELYCGNGNFTCVLAPCFNRVLATEISKTSVKSARHNFEMNGIHNVEIVRMSSEEFTQALNCERDFRRLAHINLSTYQFSTVFVDPPRAGLDEGTLALIQRFDRIIYISCNPETLRENMDVLIQTHEAKRFALFDQFPYTHHMECGVYFEKYEH